MQDALPVDIFDLDRAGGADSRAGAAANARLGLQMKRCSDFPNRSAPDETNRRRTDQIAADAHAQSAQDAQLMRLGVGREAS